MILQRKGRGSDELKSFDETEMLTSEPEETRPQNQDDEEATPAETLGAYKLTSAAICPVGCVNGSFSPPAATELVDEPAHPTPEAPEGELPSGVEALAARMTPVELGRCSPQQLVHVHRQLGAMMGCVVTELQTRLRRTDAEP